jgi:hypothetical protein
MSALQAKSMPALQSMDGGRVTKVPRVTRVTRVSRVTRVTRVTRVRD